MIIQVAVLTLTPPRPRQSPLALHDRLYRAGWLPGVVAQGSGDAGRAC
jgi:hypothetical protein